MIIREVALHDAARILEIYAPHVLESAVSFELELPTIAAMQERIAAYTATYPWYVAEEEGRVSPTTAPSAEPSGAPIAGYEAPVGIVSLYNAEGATVNWKAPAASEGITGYNVSLRTNGAGEWKLVATVPATQFKQQITKSGDEGWAQVQVSTVYSDGEVVDGKIHGLPGSWS